MASRRSTRIQTKNANTSSLSNLSYNQQNTQNSPKQSELVLPLKIGSGVLCRRDEKYYPVKIIERRKLIVVGGGSDNTEYYVHYIHFDRRLDEWVKLEQLDLNSLTATAEDESWTKGHEGLDADQLRKHEEITKVKNIESIQLGRFEMDTWYFSPCSKGFKDCRKLFFCEFCLTYLKRKECLDRHMAKCTDHKHPPGNEIYRNGGLSVFEVDGAKHEHYCQRLCFLAKLFLDHKNTSAYVTDFRFYILCEFDNEEYHLAAYFSKAKVFPALINLNCILTLPPYQEKGYGKFLMGFSYELSKKESMVGTPERPLSDLGKLCYQHYWSREILKVLIAQGGSYIHIRNICKRTAINEKDILETMEFLGLGKYMTENKRGIVAKDIDVLERCLTKAGSAGLEVDVSKLRWDPWRED